jgi:hypothetical protein
MLMKGGMFCNILHVAGFNQGQVRGPYVLHKGHRVVQDGLDAHQTYRNDVENEAYATALNLTHLSRIMTDSHFSLLSIIFFSIHLVK